MNRGWLTLALSPSAKAQASEPVPRATVSYAKSKDEVWELHGTPDWLSDRSCLSGRLAGE